MATLRTIVEEKGFSTEAERIFRSAIGADDALEGVKWELAREPNLNRYPFVSGTKLRAYKTLPADALPSIVVYFIGYDSEIHLHGIKLADQLEAEDDEEESS